MIARAANSATPSGAIVSLHPEGCFAFRDGVLFSIQRAPVQGPRVAEFGRVIEVAEKLAPRGVLCVGVFRLSPEFPVSISATNNLKELADVLRAFERVCVASASILEFGGVRAAAMRTMMRAIYAIARPRSAFADFDGLTDAVTWLRPYAERMRAPVDYASYLRLYREVERELDELDIRRGAAGSRSARA